tara:strand:+ start:6349 stop:7380 length:1032 start_codon:yes stop_codon:yes gene_type:complete
MTLIEAVPNISEGRDHSIIQAIVSSVEDGGSRVLGVEPDEDYNRTVITYAGDPEQVISSSIALVRRAHSLIDMRQHKGGHPRMGAVDVLPFIPLGESTEEDASSVAEACFTELMGEVSMFKYGSYASHPSRSRLPDLRRGGYEGLKERFSGGEWKNEETRMPDSWPGEWDEGCDRFGAMAIGVRPILIAYNVNIEESEPQVSATVGKVLRTSGFLIKSESGQRIRVEGMLESVQGMGVKLESHGISQVSMNLSNPDKTDIHVAYEAVRALAQALGAKVNGSEIVGLVPLQSMLKAGRWYYGENAPEETLVKQAMLGLGLSTLEKFDPESRIIEWALRDMEEGE